MSFGWAAATWAAVAGTVAQVATTIDAGKRQSYANRLAQDNAKATAQQAEEAQNKTNAKSPDVAALMSANMLAANAGQGGTLLTGPGGVDPNKLTLGKASLLGGV